MNPLRRTASYGRRSLVPEIDGTGRAGERRRGELMRAYPLAFASLFICAALAAQVQESITVSYVEVPVTVVDRSGNAVRGLTKENFEIRDEGKTRPIAGFEVADFGMQATESATPAAILPAINPAARRNFLLVFDLSYSSPTSSKRAQDAARVFVTKMVARQDRIGVATIEVTRGFRLLTSFTTDRSLVDAAIGSPGNFRAFDPLQLAGAGMQKEVEAAMLDPGRRRRGPEDPPDEVPPDEVLEQRRQDDAYN